VELCLLVQQLEAAGGAVVAARRREQEPLDAGVAGQGGQPHRGLVVDLVGQVRLEVPKRVVGQGSEVQDSVDPVEVVPGDVADVGRVPM
jgi:hypothetical protein